MIIEHIKAVDLTTTKWAGGTTTQLYIYPKDADYKRQDFFFRISTATVELEESVFTKLPDVSRKLMILNGEITIEHKGQYSKELKKFEQDSFSGGWDTKSYGKATDFNLMAKENTKGEIEVFCLEKPESLTFKGQDFYGIYIFLGNVKFSLQGSIIVANKGDFLACFTEKEEVKAEIIPEAKCELIISNINLI